LFPGAIPGRPKSGDALRTQVREAAAEHCGLELTPHDYRSLCGYLVLRQDRGAHGKVQRILCHKNPQTTLAHYSGLETALAVADYGALIQDLRDRAPGRHLRSARSVNGSRAKPRAKPRATPSEADGKGAGAPIERLPEDVS
jgi:integrase